MHFYLDEVLGLEPRTTESKSAVLPLHHTSMELPVRIELTTSAWKAVVLPLN